ncbi:histidine phosphatase family protein [Oceanobacter mangrovi]|uniref:histidine phosphatase family protein n=1 Tax=Oceanobacter mangrovi TaxID=2862510 RepID=UPI001C8D2B9C|nr:histidine phosphatase family protein [Oceanobacter mangrovi]
MIVRRPFVYMRHGQTGYNAHDWYCGSSQAQLTELGEQQAREAAPFLNYSWSVVIASGLQRAQHTARLAVPNTDLLIDQHFNERHFGDDEGQPIQRPINHLATPPAGEPWQDFRQRVSRGLNLVLEQYPLPLIVAHGAVFRCIYDIFYNTTDSEPLANATPVLIEPLTDHQDDSGWRITPLAELPAGWFEAVMQG